MSKHATAGTSGSARCTASSAASDFGWCSGASAVSSCSAASTSSSIDDRVAEALAAVDDPVADRVGRHRQRVERRGDGVGLDQRAERRQLAAPEPGVVGVEQRQLEAARAGVDDQDAT